MSGGGALRFGIDLGGTKTEIAVLAADHAAGGAAPTDSESDVAARCGVVLRRRAATPAGYEPLLDSIAALLADAEASLGLRAAAVGVGTPGSLSPATGLIRNANSTALNGRPLDRDLAARLGIPVRLANDADCFVLAEARAGAARAAGTVFGVILGTGVGGGVVTGGRLLSGPNAIAGEWGHNPLPRAGPDETPGPACWCGRNGCIEAWCSGPGLAADHARHTGETLTAEAIAARAGAGDSVATETLARHRDRLARALAGVVNLLDPDMIVLGGGLSNLPGLAEALTGAMRPHIFSDCFSTPIRRHALGDSAGVVGAAWLWGADQPAGACEAS